MNDQMLNQSKYTVDYNVDQIESDTAFQNNLESQNNEFLEEEQNITSSVIDDLSHNDGQLYMDMLYRDQYSFTQKSDILFMLQQLQPPYLPINSDENYGKTKTLKILFAIQKGDIETITPGQNVTSRYVKRYTDEIIRATRHSTQIKWYTSQTHRSSILISLNQFSPQKLMQIYASEVFTQSQLGKQVFQKYFYHDELQFASQQLQLQKIQQKVIPNKDQEFLDMYWIPKSQYYMYDIRLRGLLDKYFDWQRTNKIYKYVYSFRFEQSSINNNYAYMLALIRYVAHLQFPLNGDEVNRMVHEKIESSAQYKQKIEKLVLPQLKEAVTMYQKLFKSIQQSREDNTCQHVQLLQKLQVAKTFKKKANVYLQLKEYINENIFNESFDIVSIQKLSSEYTDIHCKQCQQRIFCIHNICIYENILTTKNTQKQTKNNKEIHDQRSNDQNIWNLMQVFIDTFFSNKSQQRYICKKCSAIIFEDFSNIGSKQDDRSIYAERELLIIRNRIMYITNGIYLPERINRERTFKGLDKILYNVLFDDAQQYARRDDQIYIQKLIELTDLALIAYIEIFQKIIKDSQIDLGKYINIQSIDQKKIAEYQKHIQSSITIAYKIDQKSNQQQLDSQEQYSKIFETIRDSQSNTIHEQIIDISGKLFLREIQRDAKIIEQLNLLTKNYYNTYYVFPQQSISIQESTSFVRQNVNISYIYGINGMRHEWDKYIIKGDQEKRNAKQLAILSDYEIIDKFSTKTGVLFSEIEQINKNEVEIKLTSKEEYVNMIQFFLFDCPIPTASSITHDLDSQLICKRCGYLQGGSLTDQKIIDFYTKFKEQYRKQRSEKQLNEKNIILQQATAQQQTVSLFQPSLEYNYTDQLKKFSDIDQQKFQTYATNPVFGKEYNKNKILSLYSMLFIINASIMTQKEIETKKQIYKLKKLNDNLYQFIQYVKTLILQIITRLSKENSGITQSIIQKINEELIDYEATAKYFAVGFSIYYNDFTDNLADQKKIVSEKKQDKEDYGMDLETPAFEDDVANEDDTSLPQD